MPIYYRQLSVAAEKRDVAEIERLTKAFQDDGFKMSLLKQLYPDSYDFIKSLEAGSQEMIKNAP